MQRMDEDDNRYNCSIENFIKDEYSICREERQYAVFLYNILRKYGKRAAREKLDSDEKEDIRKIFSACGIEEDGDIERVFYEAAFMRDFFERERRYYAVIRHKDSSDQLAKVLLQKSYEKETETETDFNRRLVGYAFAWEGEEQTGLANDEYLKYNLGGNISKKCVDLGEKEKVREDARAMMNSKPDIAVVYQKGDKRYLLFIECKFESCESTKKITSECDGGSLEHSLSQSVVQYHIAEFLCRYLSDRNDSGDGQKYIDVSEKMRSDGRSRIVRFRRTDKDSHGKRHLPEDGNILIKMLIEYDNKIFDDL